MAALLVLALALFALGSAQLVIERGRRRRPTTLRLRADYTAPDAERIHIMRGSSR